VCRTQQVMDDTAAQRISDAAVDCLFARGFAGTTLRRIAAAADVPVARIYEHHASKQALLAEIIGAADDALMAQTIAAIADAPDTPAARLDAVVWAQSDFHARHPRVSRVAQTEVGSLAAEDHERIVGRRRRREHLLVAILAEGAEQGCFAISDATAVSRALISMCAAIPFVHDVSDVGVPRRIARVYCDLAARMTARRPLDAAPVSVEGAGRLAVGAAA
jgi:AcrR family transcriptional regulator